MGRLSDSVVSGAGQQVMTLEFLLIVVGGCRCSPPCRREKGRVTTILFGGVGNLYIMKPLSAGLSLLVSELIWNLCLVSPVLGEEHRGRVLNLL